MVIFCFFANLSDDIDRRPIFFSTVDIDRRSICLDESTWMVDIDRFLDTINRTDHQYRPCSPVGAIEPTVDIDRD